MRRASNIFLIGGFSLVVLTGISLADAQKYSSPIVQLRELSDLDGDGNDDLINFACYETLEGGFGYDRFVIEVNTTRILHTGINLDKYFSLIDIDSSDDLIEIAVPESGPSDDNRVYFFRYSGGQIWETGVVEGIFPSQIKVDGSGILKTRCRGKILHSWWYPCSYKIDRYTGKLKKILQKLYEMNSKVTLKKDLTIYTSRSEREVAGIIHAGEKATILGSDDERFCLIESETGLKGWFQVCRSRIAETGQKVDEVFEGLCHAD